MEKATLHQNSNSAKAGIDFELLKAIDQVELSARADALKKLYLTSTPMLVAERIPFTIQAWRESEGDPLDLRWAKMAKMNKIIGPAKVTIRDGLKRITEAAKDVPLRDELLRYFLA